MNSDNLENISVSEKNDNELVGINSTPLKKEDEIQTLKNNCLGSLYAVLIIMAGILIKFIVTISKLKYESNIIFDGFIVISPFVLLIYIISSMNSTIKLLSRGKVFLFLCYLFMNFFIGVFCLLLFDMAFNILF